ncbi:UDP-N-acetylmuramoyl-L-alanine--D-glutamate ligase [Corynebacterium uterequi]|uniref:UDP-N-acetylmuramoylalanine--D-glutamate ligase n=1 Tax=Corynebacterium uterequi TaxID=1072256 RepID=A0A0G3HFD7_9CORY|nr:UDP-N-acetylmuramoyl-L-alanine--D-glutamate ligase [Corynebacterium uterequi]AKK11460.1 UDP-N-acetylmuramoylalanine--D-glutamate ligase [Corynebacterium uterequi]
MSTVMITGAGVSGQGSARLLAALGTDVILVDDNPAVDACRVAEAEARLNEIDLLVTSPGWRPDTPLFAAARTRGIEVIGDVELAYRLDQQGRFGQPRTWLVVTGTNGKTTTTAMLAAIMQAAAQQRGQRAEAVGNIGTAVSDALLDPLRVDILVAELSSFQLHYAPSLRPAAGVLLNLAEDHLDWHGSMAAYAADKARVFRAEHPVAGVDDPAVRAEVAQLQPPKPVIGFTVAEPEPGQVGIVDGRIVDNRTGEPVDIMSAEGIDPPGPAGVLDALAAVAVARTQDVAPGIIEAALAGFTVAGHRGATVHRGRKTWIDNSKATNPHAADAALAGAGTNVVWIAGGQLKGAQVEELIATHAHRLSAVGVLGVDREIIAEAVARLAPHAELFVTANTEPVAAMTELATFAASQEADVVLLAPAAASLDMYTGMAQRGDLFAAAAAAVDPQEAP